MTLHLSRITLRRDGSAAALAALLLPDGEAARRLDAGHRLIWSLFADGPERRRDFLWREERPGRFLTLSLRPPVDAHDLFQVETKPFEPGLRAGDRLRFSLRANATVSRGVKGERGQRHDVVMNAIRDVPKDVRAEQRQDAVPRAGRAWLAAQGERHGFALAGEVGVDGYETIRLPRPGTRKPASFGVLDFEGALTIRDPAAFLAQLARGFGHARAFGCGLMLIRRA